MHSVEFTHRLGKHILDEWGVEVSEMDVTDIQVLDADVKKSLAAGVRANIEAATARRNAEADAETQRILASGKADSTRINAAGDASALKIKAEAEAFRILEVAKAQQDAGKMFEKTPIAGACARVPQRGHSLILLCSDNPFGRSRCICHLQRGRFSGDCTRRVLSNTPLHGGRRDLCGTDAGAYSGHEQKAPAQVSGLARRAIQGGGSRPEWGRGDARDRGAPIGANGVIAFCESASTGQRGFRA